MTKEQKLELLQFVFSPSAPIEHSQLFVGRREELLKIRQTIEERGQHAVMFGGRGVGKTSLANVVGQFFDNLAVSKVTCHHADTFNSLWRKALSKIQLSIPEQSIGFKSEQRERVITLQIPEEQTVDASTLEKVFDGMDANILFVFDEFDTVNDEVTQILMADTIKMLSDNIPNVTVMIIGVAGSITELIGEHPSIERCIKQLELHYMSDKEAEEIIQTGMKQLHLTIEKATQQRIIDYASGFPNYVHSLSKFAARKAINDGNKSIKSEHLDWAVLQSIENSNYTIQQAFDKAVSSAGRKTQFEDVLKACSIVTEKAPTFTSDQILPHFNQLTQREARTESINYNLGMLCKEERGEILTKTGKGKNIRYMFRNPMMKAFIKLKFHENVV